MEGSRSTGFLIDGHYQVGALPTLTVLAEKRQTSRGLDCKLGLSEGW
jgi:hypothetical protein